MDADLDRASLDHLPASLAPRLDAAGLRLTIRGGTSKMTWLGGIAGVCIVLGFVRELVAHRELELMQLFGLFFAGALAISGLHRHDLRITTDGIERVHLVGGCARDRSRLAWGEILGARVQQQDLTGLRDLVIVGTDGRELVFHGGAHEAAELEWVAELVRAHAAQATPIAEPGDEDRARHRALVAMLSAVRTAR